MENKNSFWYKGVTFSLFLGFGIWISQNVMFLLLAYFVPESNKALLNPEFLTVVIWGELVYTSILSFVFMFGIDSLELGKSWLLPKSWRSLNQLLSSLLIVLLFFSIYYFILVKFKYVEIEFRKPQKVVTLVLFAIFSGISEELPLRGYLLNLFYRNNRKYLGVFITSLLFAVMHLLNPQISILSIVNLFLVGVLLALVSIYTKSIFFAVSLHVSFNFIGTITEGFGNIIEDNKFTLLSITNLKQNELIIGGENTLNGSLILTALLLFLIIISMILISKRKNQE